MFKLFRKLWQDDTGAVISTEMTLVGGITISGVVPGLLALRDATNNAFYSYANEIQVIAANPVRYTPPKYYVTQPQVPVQQQPQQVQLDMPMP